MDYIPYSTKYSRVNTFMVSTIFPHKCFQQIFYAHADKMRKFLFDTTTKPPKFYLESLVLYSKQVSFTHNTAREIT